jgi:hypothetical protein
MDQIQVKKASDVVSPFQGDIFVGHLATQFQHQI